MNRYKVDWDKVKRGYIIQCFDESDDYSHTVIDLLFHDEDEALLFATILSEETKESYKNGQISTI